MQHIANQPLLPLAVAYPNIHYFSAQVEAGRAIVGILLAGYSGHVAVQLWDGRLAAGNEYSTCRLVISQPGVLRDLVLHHDIVSVGMFEHIGFKNFPLYFSRIKQMLKSGGLFLNHGTSNKAGWRRTQSIRFINRYVFPDGELTAVSKASNAMDEAGFGVIDIEGLRRHYALTLRHWVKALVEKEKQATQLTSKKSYRLWKLYMAGCAYFFEAGGINVYQVLMRHTGQSLDTPLTRDDLYRTASSREAGVA